MKALLSATLAVLSATSLFLAAEEEGDERKIITQAQALKLGEEALSELIQGGEAGIDHACRLYAAAKRVETETALGKKDIEQVLELAVWRSNLDECADGICAAAYYLNGGGTMYSHASSRNDGDLENILAEVSPKLPFAAGKGDAAALAQIDELLKEFAEMKLSDNIKELSDPADLAAFADVKKELVQNWESLKYMLASIPAAESKKLAAFAFDSLGWIREGEAGEAEPPAEEEKDDGKESE